MTEVLLLAVLIANAARILVLNYIMGSLFIDTMNFEGFLIIIILLLIIFILVIILLIKDLRMKYK